MNTTCQLCCAAVIVQQANYCGEPILFDAAPVKGANWLLLPHTAFNLATHPLRELIGGERHRPHTETCPKWKEMQEK